MDAGEGKDGVEGEAVVAPLSPLSACARLLALLGRLGDLSDVAVHQAALPEFGFLDFKVRLCTGLPLRVFVCQWHACLLDCAVLLWGHSAPPPPSGCDLLWLARLRREGLSDSLRAVRVWRTMHGSCVVGTQSGRGA